MIPILFLLSLDHRLVGGAGCWIDNRNTSVIYAELGYSFVFAPNLQTEIRFAFSDIVRGNPDGVGHGLFLSRGYVKWKGPWMSLKTGRIFLDYADGLFLADPGLGSDGALMRFTGQNLWLDCFYILTSQTISPGQEPDNQVAGFYASLGPKWLRWQAYSASNTGPNPDAWLGSRVAWNRFTLSFAGEAAVNRSSQAILIRASFWGLGVVEPGVGFFSFGESWRAPQHYTPHPWGYYNGWGGFGEAMTWAAMTDTLLPGLVSQPGLGTYGIYWPDIHGIRIINLNLLAGITPDLSARLDGFEFWALSENAEIGREISLNLVYDVAGANIGIAGGVMQPGTVLEDMGREKPYWSLRFWSFKAFELAPKH